VLIYQVRIGKRSAEQETDTWRPRSIALVFLVICGVYFLVCRRVGIVFEWAFLAGFPAAVPFALLAAWSARKSGYHRFLEFLWVVVGFTAFYWSSVALLMTR
jgi:hypothetical protein